MSAVVDRIIALLGGLTQDQLQRLPPATRERFGALCRHWGNVADQTGATEPKAGVLLDLRSGTPRHE
ncbi:MAG TPA: hypothetical protein VGF29_05975 [Hyphomicrobiaceae bacterium]|jgi:hypothetical protein